jgi:hypothetical protein
VGGWSLESAKAVCAGDGLEAGAVLGLLTQLVNKSWAVGQREPGRETRYRLLETIHDYALARLAERGPAVVQDVRRRHADYFLAVAGRASSAADSDERAQRWGALVCEHGNLLAVLDWGDEGGQDARLRLADALPPFWLRGFYPGQDLGQRTVALGRIGAGELVWQRGDYLKACAHFEESVRLSRESGDQRLFAKSAALLGRMLEALHGPNETASALHREGVATMRAAGDTWGLACSLCMLGASESFRGNASIARKLLDESAALFRAKGDQQMLAAPLGYLAYVLLRLGDRAAARSALVESMQFYCADAGSRWGIAWRLEGFAAIAVEQGAPRRAARLYGAAEALLEAGGTVLDPVDRYGYEAWVAAAREQLGEAAFRQAWAQGRAMTTREAVDYALEAGPTTQTSEDEA